MVILASLLALTLAIKVTLTLGGKPPPVDSEVGATVVAFLVQHGFDARFENKFGSVMITRKRRAVPNVDQRSSAARLDRDLIQSRAKPIGQLTYIFDGVLYAEQPFLAPMLNEYWSRVRIKFGLVPNRMRSLQWLLRKSAR